MPRSSGLIHEPAGETKRGICERSSHVAEQVFRLVISIARGLAAARNHREQLAACVTLEQPKPRILVGAFRYSFSSI